MLPFATKEEFIERVHGNAVDEAENYLRCADILKGSDGLAALSPGLDRALQQYTQDRYEWAEQKRQREQEFSFPIPPQMPVRVEIKHEINQLASRKTSTVLSMSWKRHLEVAVNTYQMMVDSALGVNPEIKKAAVQVA